MLWVFVFGGIALAGLVMLVSYTVWLAHKAADALNEVGVVLDRVTQLGTLLGQIGLAVPDEPTGDLHRPSTVLIGRGSEHQT